MKSKKNGELYLSLMLADRTGQLQANMWDNVGDTISSFEQDDFIKVKGILHKYNGRWQITVHKIRKLGESEIDYSDYLPKTPKDIDQLWKTLCDYVESFQNHWLKSLLHEFMADEAMVTAYKNAPAAKTLHHAFVGGLLDHVVSLFTVCDLASRNYPQVNRDLLLTGAFLHDIGKLHELAYQRSISYTTKGQLLGHMIIELEMLHEKLTRLPGFPDELKILLEHMIISHHGQYEFGSPKLPMFPEALMLHYLDDLDSKMEAMRAQFEREADLDTPWTSYNPSLARPLLNTRKFLEKGLNGSKAAETPKPATSPAPVSDSFDEPDSPAHAEVRLAQHEPAAGGAQELLQKRLRRLHWTLCSANLSPTGHSRRHQNELTRARPRAVRLDLLRLLRHPDRLGVRHPRLLQPLLQRKGQSLPTRRFFSCTRSSSRVSRQANIVSYRDVLAACRTGFRRELHFEVTDAEAAGLAESIREWPPFADTVPALRQLQQRYKLAILSNIDDDLFAHSAEKLQVPFDCVVTAEQAQSYKPSSRNFELLLEKLAVPRDTAFARGRKPLPRYCPRE